MKYPNIKEPNILYIINIMDDTWPNYYAVDDCLTALNDAYGEIEKLREEKTIPYCFACGIPGTDPNCYHCKED